ncbi:glycosyltransferase family 4 protein [Candidatus Dependentiae bacterium]
MKVAIAAGGRFHALHLAHQLEKRDALKKIFTFSYTKSDRNYISRNLVYNNNLIANLDFAFSKFRLAKFIDRSKYNIIKDNLFDFWLSKNINKIVDTDIFVGWTNYFLNSLNKIKKTGAIVIAESGSCHINFQAKLLAEEYQKWGLYFPAIRQENISKMVQEYQQSNYIMTISNFAYQSFLNEGVSEKKLLKVPCGIDVDFFLQNKKKISIKKDNKFRVICVGLLCLRKGVQYLIQAWNKLNLPENNTELLLVGNLQNDLKQVLKKLKIKKNINFCGSVDKYKLYELYKKSSVFVLPSIEDGFGMVIGEAMACGLPVICTNHTAGEDLVENCNHGFVIKAGNVESLAEKILWCYKNNDDAVEMGRLGKKRVKFFSWDNYGESVFNVYNQILKNKWEKK